MSQAVEVYKFGGASVKDAESLLNVAKIVKQHKASQLIVVVSAMGKTTNALELIFKARLNNNQKLQNKRLEQLKGFHVGIVGQLFENEHKELILNEIEGVFHSLKDSCNTKTGSEDELYDKIVSHGELLSTKIVSATLQLKDIDNKWIDAREVIITDQRNRNASIDFTSTTLKLKDQLNKQVKKVYVLGGFIGSSKQGITTTLGREGSDYSASVIAYCLNAKSVTIWKDVEGVLNADPRYFKDTQKLDQISYENAAELSYYGASVIHPKTIQPLKKLKIPLYVRSFEKLETKGTTISEKESVKNIASFIIKPQQCLMSLKPKDFSFVNEKHLKVLYTHFDDISVRVNLAQHSAIHTYFIFDQKWIDRINKPLLEKSFEINQKTDLNLITICFSDEQSIEKITKDQTIILDQKIGKVTRLLTY